MIEKNQLPKGNLFDVARAAAFVGAKSTPQLLPHCHPVAIDGMEVQFEFLNKEKHATYFDENVFAKHGIAITGEAKSIGRTGIEMEMLTGVSVAALEIYDMLKPVDTQLEIGCIKLLEKKVARVIGKNILPHHQLAPYWYVLIQQQRVNGKIQVEN